MSGRLHHSPAVIIQELLIYLQLGTAPEDEENWPVFSVNEPDKPDDCITVFDSDELFHARVHTDGRRHAHEGFQVLLRSADFDQGFRKASQIATTLDEGQYQNTVTVEETRYFIHATSRSSAVLSLGRRPGVDERYRFSINARSAMRQLT